MSSLFQPRFSHAAAPGFSSLFRMLDDFDRYAAHQLGSAGAEGSSTSVASFSPRFDVAEHDKEYVLQGELPGVPPQNVEIEFTDDQTLVVRGRAERTRTEGDPALLEAPQEAKRIEGGDNNTHHDKKQSSVTKSGENGRGAATSAKPRARYWLSERSYGEFSRVFTFPNAVDQDKVQAKFKDGILDITVPKAEKRAGKKITIQ
jgi:HSP20 family protein